MSDEHIILKRVRVSFPHLFKRPIINGEEGKFGATFMLDPQGNKSTINLIEGRIDLLIGEKFKGKKIPPGKLCLRDGDESGRPEYEGVMILSANSDKAPIIIDSSGSGTITDQDACKIYGGCYVNAKVRLWPQNNNYGKRINAQLIAIQFAADGTALDGTYISVDDAMEGFDGVDDAFNDDDMPWLGDAA